MTNSNGETSKPRDAFGNGSSGCHSPLLRQNLVGRRFYESIGSPKFVLAPMVDQSEFVWFFLIVAYPGPVLIRLSRRGECSPDPS